MKIVYIAAQIPGNNDFVKKHSKDMPQYAADHVSRLFMKGLTYQDNVELEVYNMLPIASWPTGSTCWNIPSIDWNEDGVDIKGIEYCNVLLIRQDSKYKGIKKKFKPTLKQWSEEKVCIVAYGLTTPILQLFKYVKKSNSNIKTCLIVPDLPQFMNMDGSKIYHWLKAIDIKKQMRLLQYVDGMVYFSKYMNEHFNLPSHKWMVIEGTVEKKTFEIIKENIVSEEYNKTILYSGGIEIAYGIEDLLNSFMLIDDDKYELQLIGNGSAVNLVEKMQKKDQRIKYLGVMQRKDVIKHQKKATLLVNPRRAGDIFTKYSFPSKTLEYMSSGVPVIMHRLPGIPEEYDNHLEYFTSTDIQVMADEMKCMCERSHEWREARAKDAKEFVLNEKNNKKQVQRLCEFINAL